MSPQLTNVSSANAHRALKRLGFTDHGACKGSHQMMVRTRRDGSRDTLTLVLGKREINPFTMRGILAQGGVPLAAFLRALHK